MPLTTDIDTRTILPAVITSYDPSKRTGTLTTEFIPHIIHFDFNDLLGDLRLDADAKQKIAEQKVWFACKQPKRSRGTSGNTLRFYARCIAYTTQLCAEFLDDNKINAYSLDTPHPRELVERRDERRENSERHESSEFVTTTYRTRYRYDRRENDRSERGVKRQRYSLPTSQTYTYQQILELSHNNPLNVFIYKQRIPFLESRSVEFKSFSEACLPTTDFCKTIEKYINAYLNTSTGGKIFIGVENDGQVVGTCWIGDDNSIKVREQVDAIRLRIDDLCNKAYPPIDPSSVHVDFWPIYASYAPYNDRTESTEVFYRLVDRYVLTVTVTPSVSSVASVYQTSTLYHKPPVAYVKRDGSVTLMTPSMIEHRNKEHLEQQLEQQTLRVTHNIVSQLIQVAQAVAPRAPQPQLFI